MSIPTATQLYNNVDRVINDDSCSQSTIIDWFNDCLLDLSFRVQLPLLEAASFVYTVSGVNYLSLPSTFQRDLFSVYNVSTGLPVKIYNDTSKLLNQYVGSIDTKGDVSGVAVKGSVLHYQHVPEPSSSDGTESTVTLQADTISFTETDSGIADSGSALVSTGFETDTRITIAGSGNRNDGPCNISTIESDGSAMTVDKTIRDESAGETVTVSTGNILLIRFFQYPTALTSTDSASTEQVSCLPEALVKPLLVNFALKEYFGELEEDDALAQKLSTKYENRYEQAVLNLKINVGGDMKSQSGFTA